MKRHTFINLINNRNMSKEQKEARRIAKQKKQEKQAQLVIKWIFGILLLLAFIFLIVSSL